MKVIRNLRSLRFQTQLILLSLTPVLVLMVLALVSLGYALNTVTRALFLQRNSALVELAAASISQDLDAYLQPLQTTAAALAARSSDLKAQQALLQDWSVFLRSFEGGVTLLNADGVAVASTAQSSDRLGLNYAFRDYFQTVRRTGTTTFSTLLTEKPTGQLAVVLAAPVLQGGEFKGALIGVLFLKQHVWTRELSILQTSQGSQAYLVDHEGNILYHPDAKQIGGNLKDEPALQRLLTVEQPLSQTYVSQRSGSEQMVSLAPIAETQWLIVLQEPSSVLLAPTRPYEILSGLLLGLGILAASLVMVGRLRHILHPMTDLIDQAEQVSTGQTGQPVTEDGPAELRLLIRTFNHMVTSLAEQQRTLRQYAMQIVKSQEEERRRISRDLHDETVQDLVGLSQRLELCRNSLVRDPAAAQRRIEELQALTVRTLADVRRMSNDLRPLILEDLGLVIAVKTACKSLAEDLPATQVDCVFEGHEKRLPDEQELIVFRIIQEALNNIRKHARSATQVKLVLCYQENEISVRVEDNGPGFELDSMGSLLEQGHLGLMGMLERADLFDGELKIDSAPGNGTRIDLRLFLTQPV